MFTTLVMGTRPLYRYRLLVNGGYRLRMILGREELCVLRSMWMHNDNIRIEKVIRICQTGYRWSLFRRVPHYMKCVVDFRYFVDGEGPFDINMRPYVEPPKDTEEMIKLWKRSGSGYAYRDS